MRTISKNLKRIFDIIFSITGMILFIPFIIIVSILIKLESKGPVFYRQQRIGENGKLFTYLKFRTMYVDADITLQREYLKEILSRGKEQPLYKLVDDPKITKVGKILRKTSFDELPQFINIFMGDMSIVGPHPLIPYELDISREIPKERLKVKPGITGLWQTSGRGDVTFDDMIKMDIEYIKNQSLLLDLKIMLKTIPIAITGKAAY